MYATTENTRKPRPSKARIKDIPPAYDANKDEFVRDATVKEAMAVMGCGLTTIYNMIGRGELHAYKIGAATRIRRISLNALRLNGEQTAVS